MDPTTSAAQLFTVPLSFDRHSFLERAVYRGGNKAGYKARPGDWVEFGVAEGWSARVLLSLMPEKGCKLWLFDSWRGLPEDFVGRDGVIEKAGKFACEVPWNLQDDARVKITRGAFDVTAKWIEPGSAGLSVIHIDCDLYTSAVTVLAACEQHINPGTVVILDDCHGWPGWRLGGEWLAWHAFAGTENIKFKWIARMETWRAALVVL